MTDNELVSSWDNGDQIAVCIEGVTGRTGTYSYNEGAWTADKSLYWQSSKPNQTLNAWYPVNGNSLNFANQTGGLPYVLKGSGTATDITQPVGITFTHQLAKVRLKLSGVTGHENATATVKGYTRYTYNQGTITPQGNYGTIQMHRNGDYLEALVIPMATAEDIADFFTITTPDYPQPYKYDLAAANAPTEAGKVYTYELNLNVPVLSPKEFIQITGDGEYIIQGDGTQTDKRIFINGNATVTLKGLNVKTDIPILIQSGSPTLLIDGENRLVGTDENDSGIILENGTSITIKGKSNQYDGGGTDKLYINAEKNSVGIGPRRWMQCGTINIRRLYIKVEAHYAAAIGSSQGGTCEEVNIEDCTINALGLPAIGASTASDETENSTCKKIYIDECNFESVASRTNIILVGTGNIYSAAIGCGAAVNGGTVTCGDITIRHTGKPSVDNLLKGIKLHDPGGAAYRIGTGTISGGTATCGTITLRWGGGSSTGMVM